MTEARMSREITRELRVLTDDAPPPMIRAMRIERRGHPPLVLPLYPDVEYVFGRSGDNLCERYFAARRRTARRRDGQRSGRP